MLSKAPSRVSLLGECASGALPGTQLALGPGAFGRGEDRVRDAEAGVILVRACAGGCQAAGAALSASGSSAGHREDARGLPGRWARGLAAPLRNMPGGAGERKLFEGRRGSLRDSSDLGTAASETWRRRSEAHGEVSPARPGD